MQITFMFHCGYARFTLRHRAWHRVSGMHWGPDVSLRLCGAMWT